MNGVREQTRRRSGSSSFTESAEACAFLLTMQDEEAQTALRLHAGHTLEQLVTKSEQLEAIHKIMTWPTRT